MLAHRFLAHSASFALRNLISQLDSEGYFEERPLSTRVVLRQLNETSGEENRE
jgi:hypothetical protein